MQPEPPKTSILQNVPKSLLRRGGLLTAGLGVLLVSLKNLHELAGVEETELPSEQFATGTPLSKWMKWHPEPDRDQVVQVDEAADDGPAMLEIGVKALQVGRTLRSEAALFTRKTGDGHAYEIITQVKQVHRDRWGIAGDPENHNFLRGKLSFFPPFGRQLPPSLQYPQYELNYDDAYDPIPAVVSKPQELTVRQQIDRFDHEIWEQNTPVADHVALGRGGNVRCRPSGVIIDTDRKIVVRYGYMSTLMPHPLDGRALWGNVFNYETGEMVGFYVGAGKHKVATVDWLNQPIAAFVFVTMFRSFAFMLQQPGTGTPRLIGGDLTEQHRLLTKMHKEQPNLTLCRTVAYGLDAMAMGGGILRQVLGGDVIDAPEVAQGIKFEVVGEQATRSDSRVEEVIEQEKHS